MIIDGVKEKFEEQKKLGFHSNNSSFILCDVDVVDDKYVLKKIIPLKNDIFNISIGKQLFLTDTCGNILLDLCSTSYNSISIEYVNNNDLIISNYIKIKPNYVIKRKYRSIDHYYLDDSLKVVNNLYNEKNGKLISFEFQNNDSETILIETATLIDKSARLYSIPKQRNISPIFKELDSVEIRNNKLFKFTDKIKSSLEINGICCSSSIIGFITIDGKFYNGIYDELTNKEIECDLNNDPNFKEYNEIKKIIQGKLNEKVVKESNKKIAKEYILKKLENNAKNIIK